jgi:hypothetical protein
MRPRPPRALVLVAACWAGPGPVAAQIELAGVRLLPGPSPPDALPAEQQGWAEPAAGEAAVTLTDATFTAWVRAEVPPLPLTAPPLTPPPPGRSR